MLSNALIKLCKTSGLFCCWPTSACFLQPSACGIIVPRSFRVLYLYKRPSWTWSKVKSLNKLLWSTLRSFTSTHILNMYFPDRPRPTNTKSMCANTWMSDVLVGSKCHLYLVVLETGGLSGLVEAAAVVLVGDVLAGLGAGGQRGGERTKKSVSIKQ